MFIEIHSHLEMVKDCEENIKKAIEDNVGAILTCGVDLETNRKTLEISNQFPEVKACLGLYPSDTLKLSEKEIDKEIEFIKKNKKDVLAIGEIGLDLKENKKETLEK